MVIIQIKHKNTIYYIYTTSTSISIPDPDRLNDLEYIRGLIANIPCAGYTKPEDVLAVEKTDEIYTGHYCVYVNLAKSSYDSRMYDGFKIAMKKKLTSSDRYEYVIKKYNNMMIIPKELPFENVILIVAT